ncbi:MAG: hypothetical protein J0M29_01910 [Chitinophagales bacterium]|nr:hypothetical protein [Chitinophagales bacterium]
MRKKTQKIDQHTNKIWQTLKCLNHEQHIRLLRFLRSPYFISSKTMAPLAEWLIRLIEKGEEGFDRQLAWSKLFPGTTYDDVNFRKLCSELGRHTNTFMAHENFNADEVRQSIEALTFAVSHKIEPVLSGNMRQARALIEEKSYHSFGDFLSNFQIEQQHYAMMDYAVKVNTRANLEELSSQLDLFYLLEKLKIFSAAISQQRTGSFKYDLHLLQEILDYLKAFQVDEVPELALYYYSFLTLYEEDEVSHYYKFRRLLDRFATLMPQQEAIELYDSALHYCTGKINKGERAFFQEYFTLFEQALEKGVFLQKGELAAWRYTNIAGAALGLGKIEWAEQFVQNYKKHLPIDSRQNTYAFNLARVFRFQKKFNEVLDLLQNVEYEDIGVNLISKMTLLITHYERKDIEVLESFLDAFRVFLNRHKHIPQQRRLSYLNLIKYTRQLIRIVPGDKKAIKKLKDSILEQRGTIVSHEWLLEKIDEL